MAKALNWFLLVKKYTVRSKKDVEGNLIKSLYVIKRDSVKERDNGEKASSTQGNV